MDWNATEAKAKLSEVLEEAQKKPQRIRNRGKAVAVVVSAQEYEALCEAADTQRNTREGSVARLLAELESLKASEGNIPDLKLPSRASPSKKLPFSEG
jgi:prevent-host-death family protein